jgi:hypothetical protein
VVAMALADQNPGKRLCADPRCEHPQGWHFRNEGSCLECGCTTFHRKQPDGIYTIPVPRGWSVEQAWEAITRGDRLADPRPCWVNVCVRDGAIRKVNE